METAEATFETVDELITRGKSEGPRGNFGKLVLALTGTDELYYTKYYVFLTDKEQEAVEKKYAKLLLEAKTKNYIFKLYLLETGEQYMAVVTPLDL